MPAHPFQYRLHFFSAPDISTQAPPPSADDKKKSFAIYRRQWGSFSLWKVRCNKREVRMLQFFQVFATRGSRRIRNMLIRGVERSQRRLWESRGRKGLLNFGILERLPEMFLRTENFFKRVLLSVLKFFLLFELKGLIISLICKL